MSDFGISITNRQATPVSWPDIGPLAEKLRFTTVSPGGFGVCTFRLPADPDAALVAPPYLYPFNKVLLFAPRSVECIGAGRITAARLHGGGQSRWWDVTVEGYGVALGDTIISSLNVRNTESSAAVLSAVTGIGEFDDLAITATGFTFSNSADITLRGMTAGAVLAFLSRFGDSGLNPQQWTVYPDSAGNIVFTWGPRPTTAAVEAYLSEFTSYEFGSQTRVLGNEADVLYNNGVSLASVSDTDLQAAGPDGFGLVRALALTLPQLTDSADATQAANALLAATSALRMSATSLVATTQTNYYRPLVSGGSEPGTPLEPWRIRAGTLFRLRDVPTRSAPGTLAFTDSFTIVETDYDEDSRTLRIIPESFDLLLERSVAQVRALLSGRTSL